MIKNNLYNNLRTLRTELFNKDMELLTQLCAHQDMIKAINEQEYIRDDEGFRTYYIDEWEGIRLIYNENKNEYMYRNTWLYEDDIITSIPLKLLNELNYQLKEITKLHEETDMLLDRIYLLED